MSNDSEIIKIMKASSTFAAFGTPEIAAETSAVKFIDCLYLAFLRGKSSPSGLGNKGLFTDDECSAIRQLILSAEHPGQYWNIKRYVRMPKMPLAIFQDAWNIGIFDDIADYARQCSDPTERRQFIRRFVAGVVVSACDVPSENELVDTIGRQIAS